MKTSILKLSGLGVLVSSSIFGLILTTTSCGTNKGSVEEYLKSHAVNLPEEHDFSASADDDADTLAFVSANLTRQLIFNALIFTAAYSGLRGDATIKVDSIRDDKLIFDSVYEEKNSHFEFRLYPEKVNSNTSNPDTGMTNTEYAIDENKKLVITISNGAYIYTWPPTSTASLDGTFRDSYTKKVYEDAKFKSVRFSGAMNQAHDGKFYLYLSMYDWTNVIFHSTDELPRT